MKNKIALPLTLLIASFMMTSCSAIEGIFKAGFGVGIFVAIAVLVLIVYVISRFTKK